MLFVKLLNYSEL